MHDQLVKLIYKIRREDKIKRVKQLYEKRLVHLFKSNVNQTLVNCTYNLTDKLSVIFNSVESVVR